MMKNRGKIYCFRADYYRSKTFDEGQIPDWLTLEVNWQGYRISTVPWVADVARALGLINVEDTAEDWKKYLESLGLQQVMPICCEEFFEDKLLC
jgi:hypothetical protein